MRSSKQEIQAVLSAGIAGEAKGFSFFGVEYDSRNIRGGELFIALKGEATHGHEYLTQVFERGAALALVEDQSLLTSHPEKDRLLYVPDTLKAFWVLATWWRRKLNVPTIAVTGSVGKTTTKEILASILLQAGQGNYALKSFNNHVGVPYTLCRTSPDHLWAVIEVGMNRPGEIRELSKIVEPDVAVVTEVAPAHIGAFGGINGIAEEKLSITTGLKAGGTLVVNGDNRWIQETIAEKKLSEQFTVIRAGENAGLDARVMNIEVDGMEAVRFSVAGAGLSLDALLKIPGKHSARNALLAAVAAKVLLPGLTNEAVKKGLESFTAPLMRLNLKLTKKGQPLLDDSYNANPASMRALLEIARERVEKGAKVGLILGDMLELGEGSALYHKEIGDVVASIVPQYLIAVGEMASYVCAPAREAGVTVFEAVNAEEAAKIAVNQPCDMLFVKGSRGIGLDKAVSLLVEP